MSIEYRHARVEEIPAVIRAQSLGFGDTTAQEQLDQWTQTTLIRPEWRLCAFDGAEPASQVVVVPVVMNWNGKAIDASGVTDVFTLPTHRRRGLLRELMTRAYAQMHEAGQCVAILEASFAAIYQRFGWAVVYTGLIHDFDPRHLRFVDEIPASGVVRLVRREEARALIEPAYRRFSEARTLTMQRGDFEWSRGLRLANPTATPVLVAVYEEAGEVLGYAVYGVANRPDAQPSDPGQRLTVHEWVWLTPAAHRGLVKYLAGHDLVDSVRMYSVPPDDPLWYQVEEPRALKTRVSDGALARIVDVEAALAGRGYDGSGRLVLAVEDEYAPWNSGVWELEADGGGGTVRRSTAEPQLRLTPRVLAILISGYQPATTLARAGLIHCAEPSALATADGLFRTARVPVCLDHWM
ncbi:MAG: GNAT family N-acetyltransferase [Dehalococcoidia bacterium]